MLYEAGLLWVALSGGYWGVHLLRHRVYPTGVFAWMLLGAALAAALGLLGAEGDDRVLDIAGAIGLGAGACLLVLGPLARRAARACNELLWWRLGRLAYDVADVLAPGTGVRGEKRMAAIFERIANDESDLAIAAFSVMRAQAPPEARRIVDEHLASIYLMAGRWRDAIAHAEESLLSGDDGGEPASLGLSPKLWVELMEAHARVGNYERALAMLATLEKDLGDAPETAWVIRRARTVLLALAGRIAAVRALLADDPMKPERWQHHYWIGVAAAYAGEHSLASAELALAARRARGRRRQLVERQRQQLSSPLPSPQPAELDKLAALEAAPLPKGAAPPRVLMSAIACGACLVIAGGLSLAGGSADVGLLVRAGAAVHGLVAEGQWWRLATAMLLHAGATHLVLNVVSLWVIGRLAERIFGTVRAAALFCGSGLAGSIASYLGGTRGIAVGASGAIFGLLGAVLGELAVLRRQRSEARGSGVFGALALVVLVTLAIGVLVPGIDQWAHVGGILFGLAAGQALSLRHRAGRAAAPLAGLIVALTVGAWAVGARHAANTPFPWTALHGPAQPRVVAQVEIMAPARWQLVEGELVDPDLSVVLSVAVDRSPQAPRQAAAPHFDSYASAWHAGEAARARARGLEPTRRKVAPQVALPAAWSTAELEVSVADPLVGEQLFRALSFAHPTPQGTMVGTLIAPERLFAEGAHELAEILATLRPLAAP